MAIRRHRVIFFTVAILVLASLWRTVSVEREKHRIAASYEAARQTLAQLEEERTTLAAELSVAQSTMTEQAGEVASLQTALKGVQDKLDHTVDELASLQREHEQLRQQRASLTSALDSVVAEKAQLEVKLSSIKELKVAIRDIKRNMGEQRWAAWRARVEAARAADQERLMAGNRGYVLQDGVSTLGVNTKLHVRVLEPETP